MTRRTMAAAVGTMALTLAACSAPAPEGSPAAAPAPATAPVAAESAATPAPPAPEGGAPPTSAAPAASAAPAVPPVRPTSAPPSSSISASPAPAPSTATPVENVPPAAAAPPPAPAFREVTVPSGTELAIELRTTVASDTSTVEQPVRGVLRRALNVDGVEVAPAGAAVSGHVTAVERSARVKGRARLAMRFTSIAVDGETARMSTAPIAREAEGTKREDAAKIGIGAGAGAIIGGITGGKRGAVVGGTVGAAGGTGVVLATRGDEVELAAGTSLTTSLTQPLVVRVRQP